MSTIILGGIVVFALVVLLALVVLGFILALGNPTVGIERVDRVEPTTYDDVLDLPPHLKDAIDRARALSGGRAAPKGTVL